MARSIPCSASSHPSIWEHIFRIRVPTEHDFIIYYEQIAHGGLVPLRLVKQCNSSTMTKFGRYNKIGTLMTREKTRMCCVVSLIKKTTHGYLSVEHTFSF